MSRGPDGDDEELVEIDVELDGPPPIPRQHEGKADPAAPRAIEEVEDTEPGRPDPAAPASEAFEITDALELRPPIVEAADDDPAAALALFEAEADAADGGRRAALLLEVARLREAGEQPECAEAALEAGRTAFQLDPTSAGALWALRRRLTAAGRWDELAAAYERAASARPPGADPRRRADLLIERGRLLEDRLGRGVEALGCYREALATAPDHVAAWMSILLIGVRTRTAALRAEALGGLARRADGSTRRAALTVEEARAWRQAGGPAALERALDALEAELGRGDPAAPRSTLAVELDALTRGDVPPELAARALEDLAHEVAAADTRLGAALLRERSRLLARTLDAPEAALDVLDEAARLDPSHPLIARERVALALALDRRERAREIADAFLIAAAGEDDATDFALFYVEAAFDPADPAATVSILATSRVRDRRPRRADLRALELALAIRRRDAAALAEAFAVEAQAAAASTSASTSSSTAGAPPPSGDGSAVHAHIAEAAVRAARLGETEPAAALYRRSIDEAVDGAPGLAAPALQALVALRLAGGSPEQAAAVLEAALASPSGAIAAASDRQASLEIWARETLVSLYADQLAQPGRALPHQRRLVALRPQELARRVRLADLDFESPPGERLSPDERADNLIALGAGAGDSLVASALRVEAGRTLTTAGVPAAVTRGAALLRGALGTDATGLAAGALERTVPSLARIDVTIAELTALAAHGPPEPIRALRFRLAHHRAVNGAFAEALAALTPLRSEGDPLARAWSYELARRSGEAILEVAVLSEETRVPDGAVGDEVGVLLAHGEALVRAGDPQGAAESFQRALARAPDGETAADAALATFRLAAVARDGGAAALPEALAALGEALATAPAGSEDRALAARAAREAALSAAAANVRAAGPRAAFERAAAETAAGRADLTLLQLMTGVRAGDAGAVAAALLALGEELVASDSAISTEAAPLFGRAAARARLGGAEVAESIAGAAWQRTRSAALAPALTDLPVVAGGGWPEGRVDPRRARARRGGGALGVGLHLEAAVDAERKGALGEALAAYGSVVALDPDRLEIWTGLARVARAGGDPLGEARALVRLGALVRDPARAARLLVTAGDAFERAGRMDDAIAALCRAVELAPEDGGAYTRAHALLRDDLAAPGRAIAFEGLLSYRITAGGRPAGERIALLAERAAHRLNVLGDRQGAAQDWKRILKIDAGHVEALHALGAGALDEENARAAIRWLERYLAAAPAADAERAAQARLDLAASYDAHGEPARAVEILRAAAAARPTDPTPLERMSEIQLRRRDVRGAVEALRGAMTRAPTPQAQAELALRIGAILRDQGRDLPGAAAAFRQAADLDPLGTGAAATVALYDDAPNAGAALETVARELADLRRALGDNPLDGPRLERLAAWLDEAHRRGAGGPFAEAEAAVASVRRLAAGELPPTDPPPNGPPPSPPTLAPPNGRAFLFEIADPAAGGFVAEVWPHLVEAATAIFPPPARSRPAPLGAGAERLDWITGAAAALGIGRLPVTLAREPGAPLVAATDEPEAGLVIAAERLDDPGLRFAIGRGLGLIGARAAVLERADAEQLAPLFSCAALLAGAPIPPGLPPAPPELLRDVTRAIGRKDRKALALQASRFAFEPFDLPAWRAATLAAADRLGLFVDGDPATAARAAAGAAAAVSSDPTARALLAFALGDRYPALRRAAAGER